MNRRSLWRGLAGAALLQASAAGAQDDPCAARVRDGVALRRAGRDADALTLFQAGLSACPGARMRVQLAWAEQALGRWLAAAEHLREALATDEPWVAERRARLDGDLQVIERQIGRLELRGGVEGAEVFVDGAPAGTLPWPTPRPLLAGTVRVEVRRAGYYTVSRQVTLVAGQVTREELEMRREASPPAEAVVTPVVVTPVVAQPVVAPVVAPPVVRPTERSDGARRVLTWSLAGVGAAALVAGGVTWALRESSAGAFNDAHGGGCFEHGGVGYGGADCEGLRAQTAAYQTASIVTFAAGAALGAAALVLFVTAPRAAGGAVSLRCAPSPGGVGCAGTF